MVTGMRSTSSALMLRPVRRDSPKSPVMALLVQSPQ